MERRHQRQQGVYAIFCTVTGKSYGGSAKNITARWWRHKKELRAGKHHAEHLQRTWNKYGENAFEWRVIKIVDYLTRLISAEQEYLDFLFANNLQLNSSPTAYSCRGVKHSAETKAKVSRAMKVRVYSEQHKARISEKKKGELHHLAKLTDAAIVQIRHRVAAGARQTTVAADFAVSPQTINDIIRGRLWPHVGGPLKTIPRRGGRWSRSRS